MDKKGHGWIKLHRSLIDWQYYSDHNATRLLLHLLISVNYEDKKWMGTVIKAGSLAFSWSNLSSEIGLTVSQARTAMDKLEIAGEIARKIAGKYQVVTLVKLDKLQHKEGNSRSKIAGKIAEESQKNRRQIATTKEGKEVKKERSITLKSLNENKTEVFNRWLDYRKEIKKPITVTSTLEKLINRFNKESLSACTSCVDASIENGWQGLFWDRIPHSNVKSKPKYNSPI